MRLRPVPDETRENPQRYFEGLLRRMGQQEGMEMRASLVDAGEMVPTIERVYVLRLWKSNHTLIYAQSQLVKSSS